MFRLTETFPNGIKIFSIPLSWFRKVTNYLNNLVGGEFIEITSPSQPSGSAPVEISLDYENLKSALKSDGFGNAAKDETVQYKEGDGIKFKQEIDEDTGKEYTNVSTDIVGGNGIITEINNDGSVVVSHNFKAGANVNFSQPNEDGEITISARNTSIGIDDGSGIKITTNTESGYRIISANIEAAQNSGITITTEEGSQKLILNTDGSLGLQEGQYVKIDAVENADTGNVEKQISVTLQGSDSILIEGAPVDIDGVPYNDGNYIKVNPNYFVGAGGITVTPKVVDDFETLEISNDLENTLVGGVGISITSEEDKIHIDTSLVQGDNILLSAEEDEETGMQYGAVTIASAIDYKDEDFELSEADATTGLKTLSIKRTATQDDVMIVMGNEVQVPTGTTDTRQGNVWNANAVSKLKISMVTRIESIGNWHYAMGRELTFSPNGMLEFVSEEKQQFVIKA